SVVTRDRVDPRIPFVQVRLEDLHLFPGDDRPPHSTDELLALSAEHHARNDLDPSTTLVEGSTRPTHERSRSLRGGPPRAGRSDGPRRGAPGCPRGGPTR